MINKAKYNCLEELKKLIAPIVIVAVTSQEIEAIINSCTENGIKVSGLCDNETRKVNKLIKGMNVIHTGKDSRKMIKTFSCLSQYTRMCRSTDIHGIRRILFTT